MRWTTLALLVPLAACAGRTSKVNQSPSAINLEVVTLDKGAEPRSSLRYHSAEGKTERFLLRMSLSNFVETPVAFAAAATPVVDLALEVGPIRKIADKQVWEYPTHFKMIGVHDVEQLSEAQQAALAQALAPITKVEGVFTLDDRGVTQSADLNVPPGISPRLLSLLSNVRSTLISVALPKEDIGIGARWTTDRVVKVGEMSVPQTVTYTLLDRNVDLMRIGISLRQSATPQQFGLDTEGTRFDLESYEVSAVGSAIVNLAGFAPIGEMHGLSQMRATVRRGQEAEPVAMSGDLTVQVAPLPEGAVPAPTSAD